MMKPVKHNHGPVRPSDYPTNRVPGVPRGAGTTKQSYTVPAQKLPGGKRGK
jgi:hypothetical protein